MSLSQKPLRASGRHALAFVTFAFYGAGANASGSHGLPTSLPVARVSGKQVDRRNSKRLVLTCDTMALENLNRLEYTNHAAGARHQIGLTMTSQIIPVDPFDFIIFGGTGDLSERKLVPSLY